MNLALVHSRAQRGINAPAVRVEVHIAGGLPCMAIVGLPATAVRESKDRVAAAIRNSHFEFPDGRITVNLAPADLPKDGGRFDLPIAIGILAASGQINDEDLGSTEFIGELALTGELRPVTGTFSAALAASQDDRALVVPPDNASEAAFAPNSRIFTAPTLLQLAAHLRGSAVLDPVAPIAVASSDTVPDFADVRGQLGARRALEIAAAGQHNLLMVGPPGTGKSMLAARLPGILPAPAPNEALEILAIQSATQPTLDASTLLQRPFRSPHHTASTAAIVGGGSQPRPGEISMAHGGVLFLDEIAEFPRGVLESLREPMETGKVVISRVHQQVEFPADFQLIAAMNPCPCGFDGDLQNQCRCTPDQIYRYREKISGPLLDRIDLQLHVPRIKASILANRGPAGEGSASIAARVDAARQIQLQRAGKVNANLSGPELEQYCSLKTADQNALLTMIDELGLSARTYHRLLRVARTIADLESSARLQRQHVNEAMAFRSQGKQDRR